MAIKYSIILGFEGKEETIRCEWGLLYLYGPGQPAPNPRGHPPEHRRHTYTVWHEHVLRPGDQVTLPPNARHWFQAGPKGAVVWSFSTKATDAAGVFTDPEVRRETLIVNYPAASCGASGHSSHSASCTTPWLC